MEALAEAFFDLGRLALGLPACLFPRGAWGFGGDFSIRRKTSSSVISFDFVPTVMAKKKPLRYPADNPYTRQLSAESQYSIELWGSKTAKAIWAWNRLHGVLFELFWHLLGEGAGTDEKLYERAYVIWHSFQSDKNQRQMLRDLAEAVLPQRSRKLKQIRWLTKSVDKISPFRNAIAHVPMHFQKEKAGAPSAVVLDELSARRQHLQRLSIAGSGSFWKAVSGDLFVLGQFTMAILHHNEEPFVIGTGEMIDYPSPRRPRLLSLRRIAEIDRQMSRLPAPQGRSRQRRASLGKPPRGRRGASV